MRTVAVTGGIGSGKSTVCGILRDRGIPVYDSDSAAKKLYARDDALLDSIEEAFGLGIRLEDGSLDKDKLASTVFGSPAKLKVLESIVHPAVLDDFRRWNALQSDLFQDDTPSGTFFGSKPFCVIESAIVLDKPEFIALVDKVVMVDAPLSVRLKRACMRDDADPSRIISRMALQSFDLSKVDAIVRNDGSMDELKNEITKVFKTIL